MRSLRTKNAFTSAPAASAAHATGSAPIVMPPTAVAPCALGLGPNQLAERAEAGRQQDRALGVDVVLRRAPAREGDLADDQRVLAQLVDQGLPGVRVRHAACR